ncbi:MAG: hypothetical protein WA688_05715 [Thermoplasmata archaeon]
MILPGLIPLVFYQRSPSTTPLVLGLVGTVVLATLLGFVSPAGALGRDGSVIVAIVGAVRQYAAFFAYLHYRYYPRHAKLPMPTPPAVPL